MATLLTEDGLQWLIGGVFDNDPATWPPASLELKLIETETIAKTDGDGDVTYLGETNGYAHETRTLGTETTIATFQTDDKKCTFDQVVFTATGAWDTVYHLGLVDETPTPDVLICVWALPAAFTGAAGASITVTPVVTFASS